MAGIDRRRVVGLGLAASLAPSQLGASPASPAGTGRTVTTAELGWVAGEDVGASGKMRALIRRLRDGDRVVFSDRYALSGGPYDATHVDAVAFVGAEHGRSGLRCLDGLEVLAQRHGLRPQLGPTFKLGAGWSVQDLVFTQDRFDPSTLLSGGTKRAWFDVRNRDGVRFLGNRFDTVGWIHVSLHNVPNALFRDNLFKDGKYCLILKGRCDDLVFANNVGTGGYVALTANGARPQIFIDIIKTVRSPDGSPKRALIEDNVFENLVRDAIDTTGGLEGALVRRNVFRNIRIAALDIKSLYRTETDLALGPVPNRDITITDNEFHDAGIVLTTLWRVDRPADPAYAVGDVRLARNRWVNPAGDRPVLLLKDSGNVTMEGDVIDGAPLMKVRDTVAPSLVRGVRCRNLTQSLSTTGPAIAGSDLEFHFQRATVRGEGAALLHLKGASDVVVSGQIELADGRWRNAVVVNDGCRDVTLAASVVRRGSARARAMQIIGRVGDVVVSGAFRNLQEVLQLAKTARAERVSVTDATLIDVPHTVRFAREARVRRVEVSNVSARGANAPYAGRPSGEAVIDGEPDVR